MKAFLLRSSVQGMLWNMMTNAPTLLDKYLKIFYTDKGYKFGKCAEKEVATKYTDKESEAAG